MMIFRRLALSAALLLAPIAARAMSPQDLFAKVSPTIWVVRAQHGDSPVGALGSAVAIAPKFLVTACHVVAGATGVTVARDNGKRVVKIDTVMRDPDHTRDLCILSTWDDLGPHPAEIAPISDVKVGEKVYAIGSPLGLELTLTDGLVSALRHLGNEPLPDIQTSAAIAPGSSGGGLFDFDGRLIGVTVAIASKETDNLAFAYPAQWVLEAARAHRPGAQALGGGSGGERHAAGRQRRAGGLRLRAAGRRGRGADRGQLGRRGHRRLQAVPAAGYAARLRHHQRRPHWGAISDAMR